MHEFSSDDPLACKRTPSKRRRYSNMLAIDFIPPQVTEALRGHQTGTYHKPSTSMWKRASLEELFAPKATSRRWTIVRRCVTKNKKRPVVAVLGVGDSSPDFSRQRLSMRVSCHVAHLIDLRRPD